MQFAPARTAPARNVTGLMLVVLLHVGLVYALMSGLARRIVDVVRAPIETRILEEAKKPPPPPPKLELAPPPLMPPPPPPMIAPPEIRLQKPPPLPPRVDVRQTPAPTPVAIAPLPVPSPAAPPSPVVARVPPAPAMAPVPPSPPAPAPRPAAAPAPVSAGIACANYRQVVSELVYPRQARRRGLSKGDAVVQFTLTAEGRIRDVKAIRASHPAFARASTAAVQRFQCQGQGREVIVTVPFSYKLE